ncbi:hypothetical protein MKX03_019492, partial [Papaver bracteatum]
CLEEPLKPQYNGGIIVNPEFTYGLTGWSSFGGNGGKIMHKMSKDGNSFIVAYNRYQPYDTFSQKIYLHKKKLYAFSSWIQVNQGKGLVAAVFKTTNGYTFAGSGVARSGCWSMLKVDNVSLQPFTEEQWKSHQVEGIAKARKRDVKVNVIDSKGEVLHGANVHFNPRQSKASFPFGCHLQNKTNGISVRGHCIFWDDPYYQPEWVKSLSRAEMKDAAYKRLRGQFIGWDVNNENLHHHFFQQVLGANASDVFFQMAYQLDPTTRMFMNEYNTIEWSGETVASPAQFLTKLQDIRSFYKGPTGIGLESHFITLKIPYVRAALDTLASAGVPIWLTELDVYSTDQALHLEQILREAHAHPAVQGIVLWAARTAAGCYRMCEDEFKTWLIHGEYDVTINHPSTNSTLTRRFEVTAPETSASNLMGTVSPMILHLQVDV